EVVDSTAMQDSEFLCGMSGLWLPVAVAHGKGRAAFIQDMQEAFDSQGLGAVCYIDGTGKPMEVYPLNPKRSVAGLMGVQTPSRCVLMLMPHPEWVITLESNSWYPPEMKEMWGSVGPWFQLFQNTWQWCG
ncbi:CobB/CobQ-like glutamine amidotransferase domain containing protein, partial [Lactarius tabidus]